MKSLNKTSSIAKSSSMFESLESRQLMSASGWTSAPAMKITPATGFDLSAVHVSTKTSISGNVFSDTNGNGVRDAGEKGRRGQVVFLDSNGNGQLDEGERSTRTRRSGNYIFHKVTSGTYTPTTLPTLIGERVSSSPSAVVVSPFGNQKIRHQDFGLSSKAYPDSAPDAHLSGVVQSADGKETVARKVTLTLLGSPGTSYSFETTADGKFDLPAIRPGTYMIHDSLIGGGGLTTLRADFLTVSPGEQAVRTISAQSYAGTVGLFPNAELSQLG